MKTVVFVLGILSSGLASAADDTKTKQPERALSVDGGRYVFGQVSEYRKDQYMLDTKTGRLWRIVASKDKNEKGEDIGGFPVLEIVPYEDVKGIRSVDPK